MKKVTKVIILFTAIFMIISCSACTTLANKIMKGSIKAGSWDGDTFSNDWSNIKFTLPEGFRALTPDELQQTFESANDIAVNDGSQEKIDITSMKSLFDFMVYGSDQASNVIVCYENVKLTTNGSKMDAEGYYNVLKGQLDSSQYTFLPSSSAEVAGETYFLGSASLNDATEEAVFQDYYIRKYQDAFITIIASYRESAKDEITGFIQSFEKVS
ncbi:MAG: hypothetical protein LBI03_09060 [Clostridiales bacterium]|jgi:hypothetical protein|nr:hypothetical protein [Clostridiales bacterium]